MEDQYKLAFDELERLAEKNAEKLAKKGKESIIKGLTYDAGVIDGDMFQSTEALKLIRQLKNRAEMGLM